MIVLEFQALFCHLITMKMVLHADPFGRVSVPPEKRFLISLTCWLQHWSLTSIAYGKEPDKFMKQRTTLCSLARNLTLAIAFSVPLFGAAQQSSEFERFKSDDQKALQRFQQQERPGARTATRPARNAPDGTSVEASVLPFSVNLTATNLPLTVRTAGGIAVTVPSGALYSRTRLTLKQPATNAAPAILDGDSKTLAALLIELEPDFPLARSLTVTLPFDPAQMAEDGPLADQAQVHAWNRIMCKWEALPWTADEAARTVTATVDRGTTLRCSSLLFEARPLAKAATRVQLGDTLPAIGYMGSTVLTPFNYLLNTPYEWFCLNIVRYRHFRFVFDKAAIRNDANVGNLAWGKDPNTSYDNPQEASSMPYFVTDLAGIAEQSYTNYVQAGFTNLPIPVIVKLNSFRSTVVGGSSFYEYYYNRIHLRTDPEVKWNRNSLKHKVSHELFHAVQHTKLGSCLLDHPEAAMSWYLWWVEACADYASCRVAWSLKYAMGHGRIYPKLLEFALTYSGLAPGQKDYGELEYDRGYFIEYLCGLPGVKFVDLHNAVADHSAWINPEPVLAPLDDYLFEKTRMRLDAIYADFAAWFLFSFDSPIMSVSPDQECADKTDEFNAATVTEANPMEWSCSLPAEYSAKVWATHLPAGAKGRQCLTVNIKTYKATSRVDVYVLKENKRPKGKPPRAGTLEETDESLTVSLGPGDFLYVVAINDNWTDDGSITVQIRPGVPPANVCNEFKAPHGEEVALEWDNLPPETRGVEDNIAGYRLFVKKVLGAADGPVSIKTEMITNVLLDAENTTAVLSVKDIGGRIGGDIGLAAELKDGPGDPDGKPRLGPVQWSTQKLSTWQDYWDEGKTRLQRQYTYFLDYGGMRMRDGLETRWFENGQKEIEGSRKRNQQDGTWRRWWRNGQLYDEINFKNGLRQGPYGGWNETGVQIAQGQYDRDRKVGRWVFRHDKGGVRADGSYEYDPQIQSELNQVVESNEEGRYHEVGTRTGRWMFYHENGRTWKDCGYAHGKLEGPFSEWDEKGSNIVRCVYSAGLPAGD